MTDQIARSSARLWNRDFSTLWWSEAVSFFGSQLTLFAIPIGALQLLDSSASDVAWINTAAGLGTVFCLGLLGPWTDKVCRTRFMSLMSGLRALVLSAMAVLFLTGNLSLLALVIAAFLVSGLTGLYDSAFAALLPSVAHRSKLTTANTWVAGIRSAGDIGAGATAGILPQLLSPVALFISDAVTYLVSALAIGQIREDRQASETFTFRNCFLSLGSGFAILVRDRVMWPVTLSIAHFNLFTTAIQSVYVTHALRSGSMTPAEIGIAGAPGGIIGLLSMLIAPRVWDGFRPVQALMATFMLPALAGLGMLLLTPGHIVANVLLLGLSLGFWASCVMVNITGTETLKQLLIPHEALGRFSSASRVLTWGIDPIGAAVAGVLALFLPTGAVLAVASSGVVISACWIAASAAVRELPLLSEIEQRRE
ncbi:MFS transporter [Arthrobacter sp. NPDC058127]|uniref:MFS transporter n=1 Tax=Arthrobacter sp. NPDC058127 TaxID=3346351 RepID=UPI0036EBA71C